MANRNTFKGILEQLSDVKQLLSVGVERGSLSSIERDILLEKLRASYEQLLFDRDEDGEIDTSERVEVDHEVTKKPNASQEPPIPKVDKPKQQHTVKHEQHVVDVDEGEEKQGEDSDFEIESTVDEDSSKPEAKIEVEEELKVSSHTESNQVEEEASVEVKQKQEVIEDTKGNSNPEKSSTTILAEKFQGKKKSRNELLGNGKKDVASKLKNKPIGDLTKAIGINDKFLFTKELFKGNAELYSKSIKQLNEFDDINDALIYIQENFQWDDRNEAANQLIDLVRRKLLHD
ncbi:MAG: hypothetical protein ACLFNU_05215 [Bacteroidales bacterium]